jgi:hypothetical protein
MIRGMNGAADVRFVRAWSVLAFNCFLSPTTGLKVSPRCYPAINDVDILPHTNICQFVVDQIRIAFSALGNKKSVCCCVFHLMVSNMTFIYSETVFKGTYGAFFRTYDFKLLRSCVKLLLISD